MTRTQVLSHTALLVCAAVSGVAQRLGPARLPHPVASSGGGRSFYVANTGNDGNDGLSPERAWKTVAKANSAMAQMQPCDRVLFHRGDVFRDDYIRLVNAVNATASTTLASDPPRYSGTGSCQFTIGAYGTGANPLLDGADPLSLSWTEVAAGTYSAPLANPPSKLYADPPEAANCARSACPALLPMPNAVTGPGPYHFLDMAQNPQQNRSIIYGATSAAQAPNGQAMSQPYLWRWLRTAPTPNGAVVVSATNTGLQNVQATPASWYYDSNRHLIYVHLRDSSNPSAHRFEGTYRPFGVLMQSVNHVTVTGLAIAHVAEDCVLADAYSDSSRGGSYFTNEYNGIVGNQCWNYGSLAASRDPLQSHWNQDQAGILVTATGEAAPHLLRGNTVTGNNVGTADGYLGSTALVGIEMYDQDGGGTANTLEASHNILHTSIAPALVYGTNKPNLTNNGGRIAFNEAFDSQGNFFFSSVTGGRADHNYAHESYGEGIQIGGASKSDGNGAPPHVIDHNLLVNLGRTSTGTAFNGIDCNTGGNDAAPAGSLDGLWEVNNTMYNTDSAGPTFEPGCTHPHFFNNIVDQSAPQMFPFGPKSPKNGSYLVYFTNGPLTSGFDFGHNLWTNGTNRTPFRNKFDCTSWFTSVSDKNSACIPDPGFTNPQQDDFGLRAGSPAIGYGQVGVAGVGTKDAGAIPYGQSKLF